MFKALRFKKKENPLSILDRQKVYQKPPWTSSDTFAEGFWAPMWFPLVLKEHKEGGNTTGGLAKQWVYRRAKVLFSNKSRFLNLDSILKDWFTCPSSISQVTNDFSGVRGATALWNWWVQRMRPLSGSPTSLWHVKYRTAYNQNSKVPLPLL